MTAETIGDLPTPQKRRMQRRVFGNSEHPKDQADRYALYSRIAGREVTSLWQLTADEYQRLLDDVLEPKYEYGF